MTTKHIKPITELTMKGDTILDTKVTGHHVGTDIEEHVLELPSGVIEANASNCDTAISVENFDVALPDGVIAKKKLVRMVVSLKEGSVPTKPAVTSKREEGHIVEKESMEEKEEKLPDGRTVRRKTITTRKVRPVKDHVLTDGKISDTKVREELVGVNIEENVLELPVGIIEPNAANCDTDIKMTTSNVPLDEEGVIAKKTTIKMTVTKKPSPEDTTAVIGWYPDRESPSRQIPNGSSKSLAPRPSFRKKEKKHGQESPGVSPEKELDDLPEGGSKILEGDIEYKTETSQDQVTNRDGSTVRSKTISAKHIKPIYKITKVNGRTQKTLIREDLVGADIIENLLVLPPGIHEPNGEHLSSESTVQNVEEALPGGVIANKKIVKTVVNVTSSMQDNKPPTLGFQPTPSIIHNTVEGKPVSRTTEADDGDNLPDGTAIRKKEFTTKHFIPVTDVVIANGRAPESSESEKLIGMDVSENILHLPCGEIKPNSENCHSDIIVKKSTGLSPEGVETNKKLVKMDIKLKHPPLTHKVVEGKSYPKQEVVENKQVLPDGRLSRQKVVTTKYMRPVTDVTDRKSVV